MTGFPDRTEEIRAAIPDLRGVLTANAPASPLSWFRTGGPAQLLFEPADEDDLALFLARRPADLPLTVIGRGSNLLIRDGGLPGVLIRLGRGFAQITVEDGHRVRAGAGAADVKVARIAAEAGIDLADKAWAKLASLAGKQGEYGYEMVPRNR